MPVNKVVSSLPSSIKSMAISSLDCLHYSREICVHFQDPCACCCLMQDELPESLLGAVRLQNLDLSKAGVLDLETGNITRRS